MVVLFKWINDIKGKIIMDKFKLERKIKGVKFVRKIM